MRPLVATALLLFLLVPASSASARTPGPEPVEFRLKPPSPSVARASTGALRSAPLRTPRRFDVVGLRWRGNAEPEIALRTRRSGGRWSRWVPVPVDADHGPDGGRGEVMRGAGSDPVYAGRANRIQYRLSRPVPHLRLHFVSSARAAPRPAALATRSGSGRPAIAPRSAWGGDKCQPRTRPDYGTVRVALVHHTVTTNSYSASDVPGMILGICRYHRDSNGWSDIGYNFLVDRFGGVWEGRAGGNDAAVVGAHAQGFNSQTTGIANLGTHTSLPQNTTTLRSIADLIRWKLQLHGQPTAGKVALVSAGGSLSRYPAGAKATLDRISGHRDPGATSCPGDALYAQLPDLRRMVGDLPPAGSPTTRAGLTAAAASWDIDFGDTVAVSGVLRDAEGKAAAGARVVIERRVRDGWLQIGESLTGSDGRYSAEVKPTARRLLRARFAGGEGLPPIESEQLLVQVRPVLGLTKPATPVPVGQLVRVQGSIRPIERGAVVIVVERRVRGVWRALATLDGAVSRGLFSASYRPTRAGSYRFRAGYPGSASYLPSRSASVPLRVLAAQD